MRLVSLGAPALLRFILVLLIGCSPASGQSDSSEHLRATQASVQHLDSSSGVTLLDVQWATPQSAIALVLYDRIELRVYQIAGDHWELEHVRPVPASALQLSHVSIVVAPTVPGIVLVAYSGALVRGPCTVVFRVSLRAGDVDVIGRWPLQITDLCPAGPDHYGVVEEGLDSAGNSFSIIDGSGTALASTDDQQVTGAKMRAWDPESKSLVAFGYRQILVLDDACRIRNRIEWPFLSAPRVSAGRFGAQLYYSEQTSDGAQMSCIASGTPTVVWHARSDILWPMLDGGSFDRRYADLRCDGDAIAIVSVDGVRTHAPDGRVERRIVGGLPAVAWPRGPADLCLSKDGTTLWLARQDTAGTLIEEFAVADLQPTRRTCVRRRELKILGETSDGKWVCSARTADGTRLEFMIMKRHGENPVEAVEPFDAFLGSVGDDDYVYRNGERSHLRRGHDDDIKHSTSGRLANAPRIDAVVQGGRGSEIRLCMQYDAEDLRSERRPRVNWSIEEIANGGVSISDMTLVGYQLSEGTQSLSIAGSRVLLRCADGELIVYDISANQCRKVRLDLPAARLLGGDDAVIVNDGRAVIVYDQETVSLRKLIIVGGVARVGPERAEEH